MLTGPNVLLNICLSKMRRLFSSFAVKVQASDEYVTTGLIVILYFFHFIDYPSGKEIFKRRCLISRVSVSNTTLCFN